MTGDHDDILISRSLAARLSVSMQPMDAVVIPRACRTDADSTQPEGVEHSRALRREIHTRSVPRHSEHRSGEGGFVLL